MNIKPPPDATRVETQNGAIVLWRLRPSVLYHRVTGHLEGPHWRELLQASQAIIDEGNRLISFADWQDMAGYDAEARTELTIWSLANKAKVEMVHILTRHKVVAMGVSVAGVLVRNLKAYSDQDLFEAQAAKFAPADVRASK